MVGAAAMEIIQIRVTGFIGYSSAGSGPWGGFIYTSSKRCDSPTVSSLGVDGLVRKAIRSRQSGMFAWNGGIGYGAGAVGVDVLSSGCFKWIGAGI